MRISVWLIASCAAVAGCSGGGGNSGNGGGVIVTPSPTPGATPAPTPTPGALSTGEVKPAADATFLSATMELTTTGGTSQTNGVITGGTTSGRSTALDTPGFAGSYSAATGYQLSDAVNSAIFGRAQLAADTTWPNGNGTVLFTRSGAALDYLALYQKTTYTSSVGGSGYTTAQYGGIGGWQHTIPNGSTGRTRLDYFAYGSLTPAGAMPRSGTVKYSMMGSGNYASDTDLWFMPGSTAQSLTVDFAAGTFSGTITLSGENFYKNEVGGIGSLPIRGSFSGNMMTGSITDGSLRAYSGVPGQFRLAFVGPAANEIILVFVANDGREAAVGAIVGVIDRNIQ